MLIIMSHGGIILVLAILFSSLLSSSITAVESVKYLLINEGSFWFFSLLIIIF